MKVQLTVSESCDQAEKAWRGAAAEREPDFSVMSLADSIC